MLVCKRFHRAFQTALYKWAWVAIHCHVSDDKQTIVPYPEPAKLFHCVNEFSNVRRLIRNLNVLRVALYGCRPDPEDVAVTPEALRDFLSCTSPQYLHVGSSDLVHPFKDAWVETLHLIEQAVQADRLQTLEYRASGFPDGVPTVELVRRAGATLRTLHLPEPIPAGAYELPLCAHLTELRGVDLGSGNDCNSDFALAVAKQAPVLKSLYLNLYVSPPFDEHGLAAARNLGKICGFVRKRLLSLEIQHAATVHYPLAMAAGRARLQRLRCSSRARAVMPSVFRGRQPSSAQATTSLSHPARILHTLRHRASARCSSRRSAMAGVPRTSGCRIAQKGFGGADIAEATRLCEARGVECIIDWVDDFSPHVWYHPGTEESGAEEGVDAEGLSDAVSVEGGTSDSASI